MSELVKRVLVAIIGIPLGIFLIMQGGLFLFAFVLLLTYLAIDELNKLFKTKDIFIAKFPIIIFSFATEFLFYAFRENLRFSLIATILILFIFFLFIFINSLWDTNGFSVLNLSSGIFSYLYVTIGFSSVIFVREVATSNFLPKQFNFSANFILLIIVSIWICDSAAYFVGRAIGKHKLFPRHSPKKSIEGAIAGLIFSSISIFVGINFLHLAQNLPIMHILYFCFAVGVLSQAGDLAESQLKRWAEIKDSSNLIPGHGGILDRFDSILVVLPALTIYFVLLSFIR